MFLCATVCYSVLLCVDLSHSRRDACIQREDSHIKCWERAREQTSERERASQRERQRDERVWTCHTLEETHAYREETLKTDEGKRERERERERERQRERARARLKSVDLSHSKRDACIQRGDSQIKCREK